jgi:PTH1 family peptidyl-tRNA hydrolase
MKIIACLGNPGRKYRKNRHNAGAILGEQAARAFGIRLGGRDFSSITGTGRIGTEPVCLLFPQTYMTNSGAAVQAAVRYYGETPENLVVLHDEVELPFGEFREKFGGGHKGHNGLRSIIEHLGSPDFHRLRIGVGRPPGPEDGVADYVLSDFTAEELRRLEDLAPAMTELLAGMLARPGNIS